MEQALNQEHGYQAKIMAISHDRSWAVRATAVLEPWPAAKSRAGHENMAMALAISRAGHGGNGRA